MIGPIFQGAPEPVACLLVFVLKGKKGFEMKFLQKLNKPPYKTGMFKVSVTTKILIVGSTGTTCTYSA